ncbi:hypothetical protein CC78DRAFT_534682 [Lojkania enalia]|uniref:BZIP domain-containing protein n=1 Tax=Lojkania enalia TaxID=147567 RepID=A0A9P4N500_9PLEO|nr:hypothetical protein CC78DRAFT_534682 [Didymosphaeria enalia]
MGSEQHYYNAHFAQALTPTMIAQHQLTPPPTIDPSSTTTIKMEDLSVPFTPPLPPTSHPTPTPPPSDAKPVKKRKSWGQVLPEPKTNLPPRKRAKTEDEKEQRRIERVKRNRLAAHNSRERKRQEVEALQSERDQLQSDLHAAQQAMARMATELKAFRQKYPGEVIERTYTDSSSEDYESFLADTVCPRQTSTSFPSPISMDSMDSPRDESCAPDTPAYTESVATDLDQTRYPAAILCDLQCQSTSARCSTSSPPPSAAATLAFMLLFNLTISLPWMRSLSIHSSTSTSSPRTAWQTCLAWWWMALTSSTRTSSRMRPRTPTASMTTLPPNTSICRQTQAQRLSLATSISQRRFGSKAVAKPQGGIRRSRQDALELKRRSRHYRLRQRGRRHHQELSSSLKQVIQRSLGSLGMGKYGAGLWRSFMES